MVDQIGDDRPASQNDIENYNTGKTCTDKTQFSKCVELEGKMNTRINQLTSALLMRTYFGVRVTIFVKPVFDISICNTN